MNKRFVQAALAACLLSSAAVLAPAVAKDSGPTVSAPVGKLLQPAAKAMEANDYAGASTLVKQAQALPDLTPFDTYKINEFVGNIAIHQNDHAAAEAAFDAMVESPAMPDTDKAQDLRIAALLGTEQKHYDKGIKYGTAFLALGGAPDGQVLSAMAEAYYYTNDYANADTMVQKAIAAAPPGQAPTQGALEILFSSQWKAGKKDEAEVTLEKIVTFYNDPDEWGRLIDISLGTKGIKDVDALHIYRLRLASHATGQSEDFTVPASLALSDSYPVEAQAYIDAGGSSVDTSGKNAALISDIRSKAAKDRATIAQFDAVAAKTASGEFDMKLAETYMGYGRYPEAETAARRALTRGFAKMDRNEANMVLGEALLLQGKTDDAVAAFNAVNAGTPGMMQAKRIWLVFANRKAAAPAAH
jgi:tetratricopeptide (TPR) repeat protein